MRISYSQKSLFNEKILFFITICLSTFLNFNCSVASDIDGGAKAASSSSSSSYDQKGMNPAAHSKKALKTTTNETEKLNETEAERWHLQQLNQLYGTESDRLKAQLAAATQKAEKVPALSNRIEQLGGELNASLQNAKTIGMNLMLSGKIVHRA